MTGFETEAVCFEAEECFSVDKGYKAYYTVSDEQENTVIEGKIGSGYYRFHNGFVEKHIGLDWVKPRRFR